MSIDSRNPKLDIPEIQSAKNVFMNSSTLNEEIRDQNLRWQIAQEKFTDIPDILGLVRQGIAEEQFESFSRMSEQNSEHGNVYSAIGHLSCQLYSRTQEATMRSEEIKQKIEAQYEAQRERESQVREEERAKYENLLTDVEKLAPKAVDKVRDYIENRLALKETCPELAELEDAILALYMQEEEMARMRAELTWETAYVEECIAGDSSWDLPLVLMYDSDAKVLRTSYLDELPVDPGSLGGQKERMAQLREHHIDQPDASLLAALYMIEHRGATVTVDELAKALYSEEVRNSIPRHTLRSRVTTIFGQTYLGGMQKILDEEGFTLQYGWRSFLERNQKGIIVIANRERIYRAVEKNKSDKPELETRNIAEDGTGTTDIFESVPVPPDNQPTQPSKSLEASKGTQEEWVSDFLTTVARTIAYLDELRLLRKEGVTVKYARSVHPSRAFATKTVISRLRGANLTKLSTDSNVSQQTIKDYSLTPLELVLMSIFNTNREILMKNSPNQSKAVAIINQLLNMYFQSS